MEYTYTNQHGCKNLGESHVSELDAWFLVSGDTEDFIFFDEVERFHSEK